MALRNIRSYTDSLLRKKSKRVKAFDGRLHILLDDMLQTMRSANGLGLAAPQVGVLKRAVIIEYEDTLFELINPEIVESKGVQSRTEACLSVPGKNGLVERPAYVKIKAQNRNGEEITAEGEELLAVAFSHELDHLDGILYTDKATEVFDIEAKDDESAE
ncbi:MAG: peptide deformylase [Clostridiales bacterium]|nr:peptide deformylase [Clostridiales bacterium]